MVAGLVLLGAEVWRLNDRVDQLAAKVSGNDVTLGVKFDETNATLAPMNTKLDAISQRLDAEFKTIGAEIGAQTSAIANSIASLLGLAPSPPISLLPEPAPGQKSAPAAKPRP
jgi:hypothetical protein